MTVQSASGDGGPIIIKKYANRRLYNTATSSYVTLDHLCGMVQDGVDFVVYDAKTNADITRSVLTQIIVEEEAKGENLLPVKFLRQLIGLYGDSMRWMVPDYLDHMMEAFAENQSRMRKAVQGSLGDILPFGNLDDMGKQNVALFENAMKMFSPFGPGPADRTGVEDVPGTETPAEPDSLETLKAQVDRLQQQLDAISKTNPKD